MENDQQQRVFTVFCVDAENRGSTTWIQEVQAMTQEDAVERGRKSCAEDWGYDVEGVHVLGVAEGPVRILAWDDEKCLLTEEER